MIFVESVDGEVTYFAAASRFSTDEHNNLEIWTGAQGDRLLQVFNRTAWRSAGVDDDHSD